jgi:hypothetical protein
MECGLERVTLDALLLLDEVAALWTSRYCGIDR